MEQLVKYPDQPVLVVESEKTAEAASRIAGFEDYVVMTCQGGAGAINRTDWSPLIGKQVTLWPDHDTAGVKATDRITDRLGELNAQANYEELVRCIVLPKAFPEKWDLADALPEGCKLKDLKGLLQEAKRIEKAGKEPCQTGFLQENILQSWENPSCDLVKGILQRYELKLPKAVHEEVFSNRVQEKLKQFKVFERWQGQAKSSESALRARAVLTEVLWFKAEIAYCMGLSKLETEAHAGSIAAISARYLQSNTENRQDIKHLLSVGRQLHNQLVTEEATWKQYYQERYPDASDQQVRLLVDQQSLSKRLTGSDLSEAGRSEVLRHAREFENLQQTGKIKDTVHETTSLLRQETEHAVSLTIERKFMEKCLSIQRDRPTESAQVHLEKATQEMHQNLAQKILFEHEISIQEKITSKGWERTMIVYVY